MRSATLLQGTPHAPYVSLIWGRERCGPDWVPTMAAPGGPRA